MESVDHIVPQFPEELLAAAEHFVRDELSSNDASHDYSHILRVRKLATRIAREEELTPK